MARVPTGGTLLLADGSEVEYEGETASATIASGAALSGAIDKRGYSMVAVHMPAAWTAASLCLKASPTLAGTYSPVYDKTGAIYRVTAAAAICIVLDPVITAPLRFIKLWSENGAGADTNQADTRTFGVDMV